MSGVCSADGCERPHHGKGLCKLCYQRAYREANLEKVRASHRAWREANPEKVRASHRAWRKANPEKERAQSRARYQANPEKERAQSRAWREANPEKVRASHRAWHQANPEKVRAQSRAWREANPEKVRANGRAYREANPEKVRAIALKRRAREAGAYDDGSWLPIAEVVARQRGKCAGCALKFGPSRKPTHDHIDPLDNGGPHSAQNQQALCLPCNSAKGARLQAAQLAMV